MKHLALAMMTSAALFGMTAANAKNPTTATKSVSYTCQGGEAVRIQYGFNRQGLPTKAIMYVGGKTRVMPIDLAHSDMTSTSFGTDKTYSVNTGASGNPMGMTSRNYRKQIAMVTSPKGEILFKECKAR